MQSPLEQFKRQTEIVAICLQDIGNKLTVPYFAWLYNVETVTINRDLQGLRKMGIDIHSDRNRGIIIDNKPDDNVIRILLVRYIALFITELNLRLAEYLIRQSNNSASSFVILSHCIENNIKAKIVFTDSVSKRESSAIISPICINEVNGEPILKALRYGLKNLINLNDISEVKVLYT